MKLSIITSFKKALNTSKCCYKKHATAMMNVCNCIRCKVLLCNYTIRNYSVWENSLNLKSLSVHQCVQRWIKTQEPLCSTLPALSALQASGWHDAEGSDAFPGHEPCHLVQAEASHCLSIHLQNFIADAKQACVGALATAVSHLLYIHTWGRNKNRLFFR